MLSRVQTFYLDLFLVLCLSFGKIFARFGSFMLAAISSSAFDMRWKQEFEFFIMQHF